MFRSLGLAITALIGAGCSAPAPVPVPPAVESYSTAQPTQELVRAAPSQWPEAMTAVLDLGRAAAPALVLALEAEPSAPGVEAAVAVLGRLGGDEARTYLLRAIEARDGVEAFAALAIGDCGTAADRAPLLAAATDRLADPQLRAAATASLLRLGCRRELRSLVRGILLAGTPAGRALERELGLPHRPRWAYERHLLQLALRDSAGTDFGLDTDAPWAELARVADAVDRWLESSS